MDIKKIYNSIGIGGDSLPIPPKTERPLPEVSDVTPDTVKEGTPAGTFDEKSMSHRISADVSAAELRTAEEFLSGYRYGCRMLACERYGRRYISGFPSSLSTSAEDDDDGVSGDNGFDDRLDESVIRARMYRVRLFVSELKCDSNAQLMLYWHYVRGISVAKCASLLGVSRAGAFRIRRRAIEAAARALRIKK